jgi:DNA modification methylase
LDYKIKLNSIIHGDCLSVLRTLPDQSVNCCITSPPYWGLRDYGVDGQLGLEKTPEQYVARMVEVFREVRRVLKDDGTLWLNLGDSYAGSGRGQTTNGCADPKSAKTHGMKLEVPELSGDLKPKDLVGIPWMVALALRQPYERHILKSITDRSWMAAMIDAEGCITVPECKSSHGSGSSYPPIVQIRMCDTEALDQCIKLVGKGGNMGEQLPPSYAEANQRPAYQWRINGRTAADVLADAYPFMLIKRKQACVAWTLQKIRDGYETKRGVTIPADALEKQIICREIIKKLNQRESVDLPSWIEEPNTIVEPGYYLRQDLIWAKPNPMPESVTDRCTKAHEYIFLMSKSAKYYYDAGAISEPAQEHHGTVLNNRESGTGIARGLSGQADRQENFEAINGNRNRRSVWTVTTKPFREAHFATFPPDLIEPCVLAGCPEGGIILDPFFGAGTTGVVAKMNFRNYIGIELNQKYIEMAQNRIDGTLVNKKFRFGDLC